jgi:hypothetical protein
MREIEREVIRSKQNAPKERARSQNSKAGNLPVTQSTPGSSAQQKQTVKRGGATGMSRVSTSQSNPGPAPRTKQMARRSAPYGMSRIASTPKTKEVPQPKHTASRGGHSGISRPHVIPVDSSHLPQDWQFAGAPVPPSHPVKREAQETQDSQAEPKKGVWDVTGA